MLSRLSSRIEFLLEIPCIGGLSGNLLMKLVSADLKLSMVVFNVISAGIEFQSIGPRTAKEASYKELNFFLASLLMVGTLALIPLRPL